jgi:alkanesulfonate monooxygenase SsuD/methylene tetrahydromethanopterin reductase-like flavin-dependent oxidoreductase (luciferase family)
MSKLGVTLWPTGLSYSAARDLGKRAEDTGFDGIFLVEVPVGNDVMASAQAIVHATHRFTVGTGIANIYVRHPAQLGAAAVAIDELSGGRFILGIGPNSPEMGRAIGYEWKDSRLALRETTTMLRRVFAGDTPPGYPWPFTPAQHHIPIHLAAVALETVELAGEIADGAMLYLATKERLAQCLRRVEQGAHKAGRDPQDVLVTLLIPTFMSEDLAAARTAARQFLAFYIGISVYTPMFRRSGFTAEVDGVTQALARGDQKSAAASVSDRMLDAVCLVGPRTRCQEQLAAFREAGVHYPLLGPQPVQEEFPVAARRVIEAFGSQ